MNKAIKDSLSVLLSDLDVDELLCRIITEPSKADDFNAATHCVPKNEFTRMLEYKSAGRYTTYEVSAIYEELKKGLSAKGIFRFIAEYAGEILREEDGEVVCRHERFLHWRDLTHSLGQSVFVCSFLALSDAQEGERPMRLNLPLLIRSDNQQVRAILNQGFAENHHHIKGSTPAFMLAWISLMNDMRRRSYEFEQTLNHSQYELTDPKGFSAHMYVLVWKAAYIRAYLFAGISGYKILAQEMKPRDVLRYDKARCESGVPQLMEYITRLKAGHSSLDYVLPLSQNNDCSVEFFAGEIKFIYDMFWNIFIGNTYVFDQELFYAYLLIGCQLRRELIQCNGRQGFGNFDFYQKRKDLFTEHRPVYDSIQLRYALSKGLKETRLKSFETRFVPGTSLKKYLKKEHDLRSAIYDVLTQEKDKDYTLLNPYGSREAEKLSLVAHIPKDADASPKLKYASYGLCQCRNAKKRREVFRTTLLIRRYRRTSLRKLPPLMGIDACSSEMGCRPEVFSQAFRYLRSLRGGYELWPSQANKEKSLRITYHVGEDFLDISDGLRAIDEALVFFDMRSGERLGHAMAMGVDAPSWYQRKGRLIYLSRQDLLDNVVWMLVNLRAEGALTQALEAELGSIFHEQFNYVYRKNISYLRALLDATPQEYYNAWLLRGDDPDLYRDLYDIESFSCAINETKIGFASERFLNTGPLAKVLDGIRKGDDKARMLYRAYHFNRKVRLDGAELIEHQISGAYINAVVCLQKILAFRVARANVAIEVNPTSNYLIGALERYDSHPVLSFYDVGLNNSPDNPHLSVSINTDDLGVFETDLENEYMLMARALERMEDKAGKRLYAPSDVYEWLDKVRLMGLRQSWLN